MNINEFKIKGKNGLIIEIKPLICEISVQYGNKHWFFDNKSKPNFIINHNCSKIKVELTNAKKIILREYKSGIGEGVIAIYRDFYIKEVKLDIEIHTLIWLDNYKGDLRFEIEVLNDSKGMLEFVNWPSNIAFNYEDQNGYTVIPMMQGMLIPAKWDKTIVTYNEGKLYERDAYMPWWGQVFDNIGYICIIETPWDASYKLDHIPCGNTKISNVWRNSLGKFSYKRVCKYTFMLDCDYNNFCEEYKNYAKQKGEFVTLQEKIVKNPKVAGLLGTPIINTAICIHIEEDTLYYNKDDITKNDSVVSFKERARQLEKLKKKGVDNAYLHLDGWGKRGYDNFHPDVFPPCENAGGAQGMKELSETCKKLGYYFGIHDMYRDYFHDAKTYNENQAILDIDGNIPGDTTWHGGRQSFLCNSLATHYVKRNYSRLKELGIVIDGSYLDVFSVIELDECFNQLHTMTRKECMQWRREVFGYLRSLGIIASSEETVDCMVNVLDLCHHSPYPMWPELGGEKSNGVPVPLFSLVYHETIVVPWYGLKKSKGGWGIPDTDWGFLHALLNAGTITYAIDETDENIERGKIVLELHKRVGTLAMIKHGFLNNSYRKQFSTFADGTVITIDLDMDTYKIETPLKEYMEE